MGFSFREMSGLSEIAKDRNVWKALLAELLATMLLVFIGCGTCVQVGKSSPALIIEISLAFGIIVATLVQALGHISGGHMNPAVTVGCLVGGLIKPIKAALYIIFQCIGAIAGAALLKAVTPDGGGNLGITEPNENVTPAQAFGIEFIITFILLMVIFASTDKNRDDIGGSVPLAIGLTVTACHLAAIKYTGSSMNPARTFGPAVIGNNWHEHWVYWMGPCAGAAVAGLIYTNAFRAPKRETTEYTYDPVATKADTKEVP